MTLDDVDRVLKLHIQNSIKTNQLWKMLECDYESSYKDLKPRWDRMVKTGQLYLIINKATKDICNYMIQYDGYDYLQSNKLPKLPQNT